MTTSVAVARAASDPREWRALVKSRLPRLAEFLAWADRREADGHESSLRVVNRGDLDRCRSVLSRFAYEWWGVVVYSCFDSETGATVASQAFKKPLLAAEAESAFSALEFPPSSVQFHRAQSTLKGAGRSLVSACEKADAIRAVLFAEGVSFDDRYHELMGINISWWGRTTCFDVLQRTGCLVPGVHYRPEKAYLAGSTGPSAGFEYIWGQKVTGANADDCEAILVRWTEDWDEVSAMAGVDWVGKPYDSADFENALCVFHAQGIQKKRARC